MCCLAHAKGNGPDWLLPGILERNRAMEGDLVVVQPYPPEFWTVSVIGIARNIATYSGPPTPLQSTGSVVLSVTVVEAVQFIYLLVTQN